MEKKLLDRLLDVSLIMTVTAALIYIWGRSYLAGYLSVFDLSPSHFDVEFQDYVVLGSSSFFGILVAVPFSVVTNYYWDRWKSKRTKEPEMSLERIRGPIVVFYSLICIPFLFLFGVIIGTSYWSGKIEAKKAKNSALVEVKTSTNLLFRGNPHLLLKLGGDYLIYDETNSDQGLVNIIPEEQVLQISHLIGK